MINKFITKLKRVIRNILKRLKAHTAYIKLENGGKLLVTGDMAWAFNRGSYYEKNVEYWLVKIAKQLKQPVFYDIGANIGYYSVTIGKLAKLTYAFEPSSKTRKRLKTNIRLNGLQQKVEVLSTGLSNRQAKAKLNIYSSNGNNSLFNRTIPEGHSLRLKHKEPVKLSVLDKLVKSKNMELPGLIKIDVEGAELKALKGAVQTIKIAQPVILFEYSIATSEDAGYDRKELLKLLKPLKYTFYGLAEDASDLKAYPIDGAKIAIDNVIAIPSQGPGSKIKLDARGKKK